MKAYKVSCRDADHGAVVVFGNNARAVCRCANSENCDCDYIDRRVNRAPMFDDLAHKGFVTVEEYLARGWFWECSGCGRQCWGDNSPVVIDGHVFCRIECVNKARARHPKSVQGYHDSIVRFCATIDKYLAAQPKEPGP